MPRARSASSARAADLAAGQIRFVRPSMSSAKWSLIRMSGSSRVIGSWKIKPIPAPRNLSRCLGGSRSRSVPANDQLTVDRRAAREQAHQTAAQGRLAAARLTDEPQYLARAQREAHSIDRLDRPLRAGVPNPQVAHPQNVPAVSRTRLHRLYLDRADGCFLVVTRAFATRLAHDDTAAAVRRLRRARTRRSLVVRSTGLRTSLRLSPTSVSPSTISTMARPREQARSTRCPPQYPTATCSRRSPTRPRRMARCRNRGNPDRPR